MERTLLDGKVSIEVLIGSTRYVTTQLGVKRGAKLFEYMGGVLSFAYDRFKKETDPNKTMIAFAIGLLPELIVKFVDQMCLAISSSVKKESGELVTIAEAEEFAFDEMTQLATAVILANADQINRTVELLTGDVKKKMLEAFPGLQKYFQTETSPEVPTTEPDLTPTLFTEYLSGECDTPPPK
jgi:hypothetical protein